MVNRVYVGMHRSEFVKERFFADVDKYMGLGMNPWGIRRVLGFDALSQSELRELYSKLEKGFLGAFRAGFPNDAFDHLRAMRFVVQKISDEPAPGSIDECVEFLERDNFVNSIYRIYKGGRIDAGQCMEYFKKYSGGHPQEKEILAAMLDYIYQNLLMGHQKNPEYLKDAVEMVKVVAYLVKTRETATYSCESDLRAISDFDENKLIG